MQGAFEIHAILDPETTHQQLREKLDRLPPTAHRPRICEAKTHYGEHPSQPMLTWWLYGPAEDVTASATGTADALKSIRLKIEATPSMVPDNFELDDLSQYWEYHAKILGVDSEDLWDKAAQISAPFGAHLFWNGCKPLPESGTPIPVIALRRYLCTKAEANREMSELETALIEAGFSLTERHAEWGILDTKPELDRGWLYTSDDRTKFLREIPA